MSSLFSGPPRFHSPRRIGVRPGSPLLHRLGVTGTRPIEIIPDGLPEGLRLEALEQAWQLRGRPPSSGTITLHLVARNADGEAKQKLEITVGEQLTYAPPWDSTAGTVSAWNARRTGSRRWRRRWPPRGWRTSAGAM